LAFFIGADPKVRSFSGGFRRVRFGPDVFADALVPSAGASSPGDLINKIPKAIVRNQSRLESRGGRLRVAVPLRGVVVIALPNGRVNRISQIRH
jgi:hypothetical protein